LYAKALRGGVLQRLPAFQQQSTSLQHFHALFLPKAKIKRGHQAFVSYTFLAPANVLTFKNFGIAWMGQAFTFSKPTLLIFAGFQKKIYEGASFLILQNRFRSVTLLQIYWY